MLEILTGLDNPTINTVGEQGQFYIRQYQSGRRTYSGDLFICKSIFSDNEDLQNPVTTYNWQPVALTEEVKRLLHEVSLDFDWKIEELEEKITTLSEKPAEPEKLNIKFIPADCVWQHNTEFRLFHLGKIGRLDFKLPENVPNEFKGKLFIRSSNNGIQLNIDNVIFTGEDCVDGKLVSTSSKYYEIAYENVGIVNEQCPYGKWIVIAKVSSLPIQ